MADSEETVVRDLSSYDAEQEILDDWTPVKLFVIEQEDEEFRHGLRPFNYDGGFVGFPTQKKAIETFDMLVATYGEELRDDVGKEGEGEAFIGVFEREGQFIVATGQSVGDSSWIFDRSGLNQYSSPHLSYEGFLSEHDKPYPMNP